MEKLLQENHEFFALVKGFRNGAVYGTKIRFPHALVMTFLFRDGRCFKVNSSLHDKCRAIFKATFQHARNLAYFVTIYKSLMLFQRLAKGKEHESDALIAGLIGGYVVFGEDQGVNQQIVYYLLSRVTVGSVKLAAKKGLVPTVPQNFPLLAATVWGLVNLIVGLVMWLFRHNRDTLQPSLQSSMQYLYNDSEHFSDLRTLLWHNK